jgi:hypothetical protein
MRAEVFDEMTGGTKEGDEVLLQFEARMISPDRDANGTVGRCR